MKLVKPNQISGEIMTLLDEADEKVVIVSPYCKIDKWYKLINKFSALQERKIPIEFYVRENETDSISQIRQLGIEPITVSNLHAKLYMNEKYAIVTSMNLLLSSEINSLEIGYKTTSRAEYDELIEFYNRYLKKETREIIPDNFEWKEHLQNALNQCCGMIRIFENDEEVNIKTPRNNYNCFIWSNKKKRFLRMSGILSGKEFNFAKENMTKIQSYCDMELELIEGKGNYYHTIWATQNKIEFNSSNLTKLISKDKHTAATSLASFILAVEKIKDLS